MTTRTLSGILILGNAVLVLVAVIIMFAIALPAKHAGRPFRRAQVIAFVFAALAMAGAVWNVVITFSS